MLENASGGIIQPVRTRSAAQGVPLGMHRMNPEYFDPEYFEPEYFDPASVDRSVAADILLKEEPDEEEEEEEEDESNDDDTDEGYSE